MPTNLTWETTSDWDGAQSESNVSHPDSDIELWYGSLEPGMYLYAQERNGGINQFETTNSGYFTSSDKTKQSSFGGCEDCTGGSMSYDGTKFYFVESGTVYQYGLSAPFDIGTGSQEKSNQFFSADPDYGAGLTWFNDGSNAYLSHGEGDPGEMDLLSFSTPWDIGTATVERTDTLSWVNSDQGTGNIEFNPDGTRGYFGERGGTAQHHQIEMSTAFDLSSITSHTTRSTSDNDALGFVFSPDGEYYYTGNHSPDAAFRYNCSTAWDITTASKDAEFYSPTSSNAINGLFISGPAYYDKYKSSGSLTTSEQVS